MQHQKLEEFYWANLFKRNKVLSSWPVPWQSCRVLQPCSLPAQQHKPSDSLLPYVRAHARTWRQTSPHPHISVNHLAYGSMAAPATALLPTRPKFTARIFSTSKRWISTRSWGSVTNSSEGANTAKSLRTRCSVPGRRSFLDSPSAPWLKCLQSGYHREETPQTGHGSLGLTELFQGKKGLLFKALKCADRGCLYF